jgi:hypothetical protein
MVFKPLKNANMRQTERTATFQRDADLRARAVGLRDIDA